MKVSWVLEMSRSLDLADLSLYNTVAKESRKYNYPEKMSFRQAVEENIAAKMKKTDYIYIYRQGSS